MGGNDGMRVRYPAHGEAFLGVCLFLFGRGRGIMVMAGVP